MNQITGFKTLIGTLYKQLNKASVYGELKLKYLYILNIIQELLYDCPTCLNHETKSKLQDLIITIQNLDDNICIYREQRSLYTNIIGCKDCNPNNSSLQVINTAPIIDDPNPIEPELEKLASCGINAIAQLFPVNEYLKIEFDSYFKCQDLINPTKTFNKLKFLSLPTLGIIQFNNQNIIENQIIDIVEGINPLDPTTYLFYTPFVERGLFIDDSFDYILYTNDLVPLETEVGTSTIKII